MQNSPEMTITLNYSKTIKPLTHQIVLLSNNCTFDDFDLSKKEKQYVIDQKKNKDTAQLIVINRYDYCLVFAVLNMDVEENQLLESSRKLAAHLLDIFNKNKFTQAYLDGSRLTPEITLAFSEAMSLANYQFIKYFKETALRANSFNSLTIFHPALDATYLEKLQTVVEATLWAREMVNEPLNRMNATAFGEQMAMRNRSVGVKAEVLSKRKIESLKMGGLLAVNSGSVDPPSFTILEWTPEHAKNNKPIILVGKGVVYDTGGMSLKPTRSMDTMKSDMAGGAAVAAAIYAAAKLKLPFHLIALIPATDNRVNGNAFVPGDVITTFDGTSVEVLNTDAEGRLVLADALSYAKKYDPQLVISFATLTGAAQRAIGSFASAAMQVKATNELSRLVSAGNKVFERLVVFPMWAEYADFLKSDIADLKNIGGMEAGMITAAKFLEHFTNYPFIHIDIAGTSFQSKKEAYLTAGGTGVGVRLILAYLESLMNKDLP